MNYTCKTAILVGISLYRDDGITLWVYNTTLYVYNISEEAFGVFQVLFNNGYNDFLPKNVSLIKSKSLTLNIDHNVQWSHLSMVNNYHNLHNSIKLKKPRRFVPESTVFT